MTLDSANSPVWIEPAPLPAGMERLTTSRLVSAVLYARGVRSREDANDFLSPTRSALSDPLLLPDVERAAERLRRAIKNGERIGIFGDYDVDGLTSTAMLVRVLRRLGADPLPIVPNRLTEAYGLSYDAIDRFQRAGIDLMVALDCGSSNSEELGYALSRGIDCIVIDHHHLGEPLPDDVIFVSPRRLDSRYPTPNPAAVGVVWSVVRALLGDSDAEMYLPYVALGTVADVVELSGQNRVLAARGISKLRRWKLPGIIALCCEAGIDQTAVRTRELGFVIGPRLNAAGRMASPEIALNLLLADSAAEATPLALQLATLNQQRQVNTSRMVAESEAMLESSGGIQNHPAIVVGDPEWSVGIAGIVAGRLADRYHRPAIVLEQGAEVSRGSGRSVGSIDLVEALRSQADLLERFGGHAHAAGLSMPTANVDEFRRRFQSTTIELAGGSMPRRTIIADVEACADELTLPTLDDLDMLEPFGEGNRYPSLLLRSVRTRWGKTSADGKHLLFNVESSAAPVSCVAFGAGARLRELTNAGNVDIIAELRRDEFGGRVRPKLYITDFRPSSM